MEISILVNYRLQKLVQSLISKNESVESVSFTKFWILENVKTSIWSFLKQFKDQWFFKSIICDCFQGLIISILANIKKPKFEFWLNFKYFKMSELQFLSLLECLKNQFYWILDLQKWQLKICILTHFDLFWPILTHFVQLLT